MTDDDACFGDETLDVISDGLNVVDAVVYEEDLPIARQFTHDRALHALFVVRRDLRDDSSPI